MSEDVVDGARAHDHTVLSQHPAKTWETPPLPAPMVRHVTGATGPRKEGVVAPDWEWGVGLA